jgi:hypothetical protein
MPQFTQLKIKVSKALIEFSIYSISLSHVLLPAITMSNYFHHHHFIKLHPCAPAMAADRV